MPYTLSTRKEKGKTKYCMTSKDTGKTYCYDSETKRTKGMKMHEMFKNMPRSKIRIAKKSFKKGGKVKKTGIYKLHKGERVLSKLKKGGIGAKQAARVMKTFYAGKLRSKNGRTVTDVNQAQAIAMSEGRVAEARGVAERTFKGRTRIRPKLKKTAKINKKKYSTRTRRAMGWA